MFAEAVLSDARSLVCTNSGLSDPRTAQRVAGSFVSAKEGDMKFFAFPLTAIASGAVLLTVHANSAIADPAAIQQQIASINKSYSEVESLSTTHIKMLTELLETISHSPSGWTVKIGKQAETPMTKELVDVIGSMISWPPPGGAKYCDIIDGCNCVGASQQGGVHICFRQ
jgi:hypothetical protein